MRRALAIALLTLGAFLLSGPGTAVPQGGIVIWGAASGTHLRLEARGPRLLVSGLMARAKPRGCRFIRYRRSAACRLAGAGSIVIEAGPSDDKIKVLNGLPLPLVAYLGSGSDKLIGNAERDTCYPEGTKRNRCIGGGGDDTCIAEPVNSDCVGGPGDDYCKTSGGSDGCWGGPGRDICLMGPGHDGCHGDAGDDTLYGGNASDQLYGGRGFDDCDGGPGVGRSHGCESGPRR